MKATSSYAEFSDVIASHKAALFFIHGEEVFRMARFVPMNDLIKNTTQAVKMI